jgi:hypothetical protein
MDFTENLSRFSRSAERVRNTSSRFTDGPLFAIAAGSEKPGSGLHKGTQGNNRNNGRVRLPPDR